MGLFTLKDEPEEADLLYKPSISLFAAKKSDEIYSSTKSPTVAATLRSEATLAEIACQEENTQKRKFSEKFIKPDLSLITKTEDSNKENTKKRKVDYRIPTTSRSEEEQEQRRLQLQELVDKFMTDSNSTTYEFPADMNGHDRKIVHEIASDLSLNHESVGSGKKRRVVLKKIESGEVNNAAKDNKKAMLPRRDVLPGERPITPPSSIENKKKSPTPNKNAYPTSSFRNTDENKLRNDRTIPKREPKVKAFSKLFDGVKFVISGYQNPLRGDIRKKALDMGGKYSADWDNTCTHLICAFVNTPKFNQVRNQSKNAKIVKKDWIEKCFEDKIRYPWRRHCLDPTDAKVEESEEEIWDEKMRKSAATVSANPDSMTKKEALSNDDPYDKDTDDEIDEVLRERKANDEIQVPISCPTNDKTDTISNPYKAVSSESTQKNIVENSDDAYNADTDVDEEDSSIEPPSILKLDIAPERISAETLHTNSLSETNLKCKEHKDYFLGLTFLLYGVYGEDEARKIKKNIVLSGGLIEKFMSSTVDYIICQNSSSEWDRNFDIALNDNPKVKLAQSQFIHDCNREQKLLTDDKYFIRKK